MTNEIKIEKGIELPANIRTRIYPFDKMEVGDSFLWTGDQSKLVSAASYYGIRHAKKFTVREADGGYRAWRVE